MVYGHAWTPLWIYVSAAVGGRLSLGVADPGRGHGFRLIATVPLHPAARDDPDDPL